MTRMLQPGTLIGPPGLDRGWGKRSSRGRRCSCLACMVLSAEKEDQGEPQTSQLPNSTPSLRVQLSKGS